MQHYTGMAGASILAALTLLACLTTSIGLLTSLSQDWSRRFPKISYHKFLIFATIISFSIANFGLDQIILYSSPILSFLYPLAIALIILGIMNPLIGRRKLIYRSTISLTMIPAILDLIHNLPPIFAKMPLFSSIDAWASSTIPLYSIGLDFLPFMLIGLFGSWAISKFAKAPMPASESSTTK
jgi:LIVCS family branched-chain amino acid:cation transporter